MSRRDSEWYELEEARKKEWIATLELWDVMDTETADSQLENKESDPRFDLECAISNIMLQGNDFGSYATEYPETHQYPERTWPKSPQMLAVETATRDLLGLETHIEPLQLPLASRDFLSRRFSDVEMQTANAPRYVTLPIRDRNPISEPTRLAESHLLKLIEIEQGDATIYDPPLQVIQGSYDHRTLAIICKPLDAEAAKSCDEQALNETRALLVLQIETFMQSIYASQKRASRRNKPVIQRLLEIRERLVDPRGYALRRSETPTYLPDAHAQARYMSVDAYVNMDDWQDTDILLHDRV